MAIEPRKVVTAFRPRTADMLATIRTAAADSKNVMFGDHALDRMEERGITTLDALRILRTGDIDEPPEPGRQKGEWKCKVTARLRGSRDAGVITIVMITGRLFVKTVEWEDL
jgi:hypothetical protein